MLNITPNLFIKTNTKFMYRTLHTVLNIRGSQRTSRKNQYLTDTEMFTKICSVGVEKKI